MIGSSLFSPIPSNAGESKIDFMSGVIAELLRGRRPREWSPIVIRKGVLVIFYGHGKRNGSRARAPYIHTYIRTYVAFHDILT